MTQYTGSLFYEAKEGIVLILRETPVHVAFNTEDRLLFEFRVEVVGTLMDQGSYPVPVP